MADYDYDKLLEQARKQLPKTVLNQERFEIPHVKSMIIGSKTEFINFAEAAGIIRRKPEEILKFLSRELASFGEIDNRKVVFKGKFGNTMLNDKFRKYVSEFVLCKECGKPDTAVLREGRQRFLKCEACGAKRTLGRMK